MTMEEIYRWVVGAAVAVLSFLARYFWKRHEECETDRKDLREKVGTLDKNMATFMGCQNDPCGAKVSMKLRREFEETYHILPNKKTQ